MHPDDRLSSLVRRIVVPVALLTVSACATAGGSAPVLDLAPPSAPSASVSLTQLYPAERVYVADTASVIYRRRQAERTRDFVFSNERGFGICLRSPTSGGYDHTLLILQRRITEDFIPQAADDVVVLRSTADVMLCKGRLEGDNAWVKAR